jgi:hypothetical protein
LMMQVPVCSSGNCLGCLLSGPPAV